MLSDTEQIDNVIKKLLADPNNYPASVNTNVARYIHDLILKEKPALVVEIGCHVGFSTLHITKALVTNNKGTLLSFDLDTDVAERHIAHAGLSGKVHFVKGNSVRMGSLYSNLLRDGIDFLFIDGDHTRRGCLRDGQTFIPFLKPGGILILHDIYPEQSGWLGPRYLLDIFESQRLKQGKPQFIVEELASLDSFGVAVCQKCMDATLWNDRFDWLRWFRYPYTTSHLAQFFELARFEGKTTPLQMIRWLFSKWSRIGRHW